ncbi:MAG TPA: DUF5985 family protein [Steroidobacteraceae bacterium]
MAESIYILCALTGILCAVLLYRGYRANRTRLLFWASLAFLLLAADNVILYFDLVILPALPDLFWYRTGVALAGMLLLVFGLVWETR